MDVGQWKGGGDVTFACGIALSFKPISSHRQLQLCLREINRSPICIAKTFTSEREADRVIVEILERDSSLSKIPHPVSGRLTSVSRGGDARALEWQRYCPDNQ
jgi:hypothetical protein